jgi:hypothetical protein
VRTHGKIQHLKNSILAKSDMKVLKYGENPSNILHIDTNGLK